MQDIPKVITIKKVITDTPNVKTFVFHHKLGAKPGQFVNVWIPRLNEKPISVAYDNGKEFWLTIFAVGEFSRGMHGLKAGDMVGIRGPYGKGFTFKARQHLVLMAGGYGAAPLYNVAMEAVKKGCKIDFVIGARSKEHLLFISKIKKLKNVTLHIATDDGSAGIKGYNTLILEQLIAKSKKTKKKIDCVCTCGPEMMMKKISDICFENKIAAQLSIERYMKCGFGVCGQCCVDGTGERMCKDGPVVDNNHARKISEFGKYHRDSVGRIHNY